MKKTVSLLLLALMLFSLAACGGNANSSSNTPSTSTPSTSTPSTSTPATTTPTPSTPDPVTPEPDDDTPQYGGVVKMITNADTSYAFGLPWNSARNNATQPLVPFGECLVLETTGGDIHPWLATSWETDPVALEVRLQLRDDVYFSDGSKFNAEVVVWNVDMAVEAKAINPSIAGAEARGEYEVAILMANNTFSNIILNLLASHSFCIVSKEHYEKHGEEFAGENPCGTGPFIMTEKNPGVGVKYERNPNYWQEGKPYLDGFEFVVISDAQTQINAMTAPPGPNRVDVLNNAVVEQLSILSQDPDLTVYAYPGGVTCLFPSSINEDSPFADLRVRQALSYAIDRDALSEARGFGYLMPATQFVPYGYYGHFRDERNLFEYDPAKAKALLAEAGYPNGFSTNYYASATSDRDLSTAITKMLSDVGIETEMSFLDAGAYTALRSSVDGGWEGLTLAGLGQLASMPSSYRLALDAAGLYNKSTKRPDGWPEAFVGLSSTINFSQEAAEVTHNLLFEDMTMVPMLNTVTANVTRNSLKDAEYGFWGVGTQWLPSEMWVKQ